MDSFRSSAWLCEPFLSYAVYTMLMKRTYTVSSQPGTTARSSQETHLTPSVRFGGGTQVTDKQCTRIDPSLADTHTRAHTPGLSLYSLSLSLTLSLLSSGAFSPLVERVSWCDGANGQGLPVANECSRVFCELFLRVLCWSQRAGPLDLSPQLRLSLVHL